MVVHHPSRTLARFEQTLLVDPVQAPRPVAGRLRVEREVLDLDCLRSLVIDYVYLAGDPVLDDEVDDPDVPEPWLDARVRPFCRPNLMTDELLERLLGDEHFPFIVAAPVLDVVVEHLVAEIAGLGPNLILLDVRDSEAELA